MKGKRTLDEMRTIIKDISINRKHSEIAANFCRYIYEGKMILDDMRARIERDETNNKCLNDLF